MTAFSRAFILAGLVAVTGATGALADPQDHDQAQTYVYGAQEQNAPVIQQNEPVLQEGRASASEAAPAQQNQYEKSWLTDRRSSDWN